MTYNLSNNRETWKRLWDASRRMAGVEEAVEIELKNGRVVQLGTDQPEKLKQAIDTARQRVSKSSNYAGILPPYD
jgi:hypothetical protein